jgi:Rv2632c-like
MYSGDKVVRSAQAKESRWKPQRGTLRSSFEDGDRTRAEAVLRTSAGTELRHEGIARGNRKDTDVPEIGEELAAARASGLVHDLFEATVADIEANVQDRGPARSVGPNRQQPQNATILEAFSRQRARPSRS